VRFGPFELDLSARELRKHGVRLKLYDQPFAVLTMLIARPGELITREEIRQQLWPGGTFVDFENGLNRAVNRLRDTLGDSADEPKFVETIPRHGYRFISPIESVKTAPASFEAPTPQLQMRQSKYRHWLAAAAAVAAILLAASAGWHFYPSPKPTLNFGERDWVLISSFENRTGNPVLDGTLEYALERELSNSQFVNVVPRERAGDALRLMQKPLDAKIDAALGREICLRDGGIRALLTGRVEKLGTTYVMSAELINPANGVVLASMSEEDPADSQMAAAVRRLSNRVRETLGEKVTLIQQSNQHLEKVTTPSLRALQLYTQASELMWRDTMTGNSINQAEAAELLERAIAEDPGFASAHLLLGWTYHNRSKDALAQPEFQRSLDLSDSVSDRERSFILASYYDVVKQDNPKAISAYEALLRIYPDHIWAVNNLANMYVTSGLWDDGWRLIVRVADLLPDSLGANEMATCGMYFTGNPDGAGPYMQRVRALAAADPKGPFTDEGVELLPVFYNWSQGDVAKARSQFLQLEKKSEKDKIDAIFLWSFGELAEAEQRFKVRWSDPKNELFLGWGAYIKGDLHAARTHFEHFQGSDFGWTGSVGRVVMGRSGLWDRVESSIPKDASDPETEVVRGELYVARGRTQEGTRLLEKGLDAMHSFPVGAFFLGSETLARAYEKQGKFDAALRVLRRASNAKEKAYSCFVPPPPSGHWWFRDELQLADLYRKMNRVAEAEQVENELRKMLIYADADHPILRELKKREQLSVSVTPNTVPVSH